MKKTRIAVVVLALAGLAGCANTQVVKQAAPGAKAGELRAEPQQAAVSRPVASYGSLGGYRYRRFVAVGAPAS